MIGGYEFISIVIILIIITTIKFLQETTVVSSNSLLYIIPHNDNDNIIKKINSKKNEIYNMINNNANRLGLSIQCIKSSNIDNYAYVICSANNNITPYKTKEANAIIIIEPEPFYKYDVIISIKITTNNYQKTYEKIIDFNEQDSIKILKIITSENGKIKYKPKRYSNSMFIFWRPKNKLIDKYAKKFSIFNYFPFSIIYLPVGLVKSLYRISHRLVKGRSTNYKVTMGKPYYEPRSLFKLDSWQTVVLKSAKEKENIIKELEEKLIALNIEETNFVVKREKIWYWGINGKEEREQLTCSFNRTYVFVHIYPYGEDLYIGWDANLNYATWEEYYVTDAYTNGKIKNIKLSGKMLMNMI